MSATGRVFRRCGCRGDDGRQLGAACPKRGRKGHGTWGYVLDLPAGEDGRRRQRKRGGYRTRDEAQAALDEARGNVRHGVEVDDRVTLGQWLEAWLAEKSTAGASSQGRTLRPTTAALYRQQIDAYLIPTLGHVRLDRLRAEDISAALRTISEQGQGRIGAATIERVYALLRAALNGAVRSRRIPYNPALQVTPVKAQRHRAQPWSRADLEVFLTHAAGHRLGGLFELMALTALRRGEALGLRWCDVDIDGDAVLVVRQQLVNAPGGATFGRPKTARGEDRIVPLSRGAVGVLLAQRLAQDAERAQWGEAYNDHGLVFAREDGPPLDPAAVSKAFAALAEDAGVRHVRLHDLRHGAISLALAGGVDIKTVSAIAGHSSYAFTADRYGHLMDEGRANYRRAMDGQVPSRDHLVTTEATDEDA